MLSPAQDAAVQRMADDLVAIEGVVAVVIGGSHARGADHPGSDVDLGLYTRPTFDVAAVDALARRWSTTPTTFVAPGGWGPWVDCGAWLTVDDVAVDWIRRDLDRVEAQWERAERGAYAFHPQPGHPLGFLDVAYCGEVAHARIVADPSGELQSTRERMQQMPDVLGEALVAGLWEADLTLAGAAKAAPRGDAAYVSLCVAQATLLAAHALHGRGRRWATNEKGLVAAAATTSHAPPGFAASAADAVATGSGSAPELVRCVDATRRVVDAVRAATA